MSDTIATANFRDAVDISAVKILVDGDQWGFISGLTVDGKSPEELINCIGGTLRRRKPESTEWSADAAVLYNNVKDLAALKSGKLFEIVVEFDNPDTSDNANIGQTLTVYKCRVNDHSISITEGSTFRMSGMAERWDVDEK